MKAETIWLAASEDGLREAAQHLRSLVLPGSPDMAAVRSTAQTAFGRLAAFQADRWDAAIAVRRILSQTQRETVRRQVCASGGMMPGMSPSR